MITMHVRYAYGFYFLKRHAELSNGRLYPLSCIKKNPPSLPINGLRCWRMTLSGYGRSASENDDFKLHLLRMRPSFVSVLHDHSARAHACWILMGYEVQSVRPVARLDGNPIALYACQKWHCLSGQIVHLNQGVG